MSTVTLDHSPSAYRQPVWRGVLRWTRETPAPLWNDAVPHARTRATLYLVASMGLWTAAGLGGAALVGRLLELIPPVL